MPWSVATNMVPPSCARAAAAAGPWSGSMMQWTAWRSTPRAWMKAPWRPGCTYRVNSQSPRGDQARVEAVAAGEVEGGGDAHGRRIDHDRPCVSLARQGVAQGQPAAIEGERGQG